LTAKQGLSMPLSKKRTGRRSGTKQSPPSKKGADGNGIALYHEMRADEDFETTAHHLFQLVRNAARQFPGKPRMLYLDVEGHRNEAGGYDRDALELFRGFVIGYLGQFLTGIPTIGGYAKNPNQREDIPDCLVVSSDVPKEGREQALLEQARSANVLVHDADTGNTVYPDGTIQRLSYVSDAEGNE
jgi:hypothetical protein